MDYRQYAQLKEIGNPLELAEMAGIDTTPPEHVSVDWDELRAALERKAEERYQFAKERKQLAIQRCDESRRNGEPFSARKYEAEMLEYCSNFEKEEVGETELTEADVADITDRGMDYFVNIHFPRFTKNRPL